MVGSLNLAELVKLENVVIGGGGSSADGGGGGGVIGSATFSARAPFHNNPIGTLHGGCQAMLAEQLGAKCASEGPLPMSLGAIQVSFFRAGAGQISLDAHADDAGAGKISTSIDLTNAQGKLISQASLSWNQH